MLSMPQGIESIVGHRGQAGHVDKSMTDLWHSIRTTQNPIFKFSTFYETFSLGLLCDTLFCCNYFAVKVRLNIYVFFNRLVKPQYLVPFLQPGRLVRVKQGEKDFGLGVIISFKKLTVKVCSKNR